MARLEDLIKDIVDPRLRDQIAGEVTKLKAKKKFGLVFEEHLPEVVRLPGMVVKLGARVAKLGNKEAGFFVVKAAVNGRKVSIVPEHSGPEEIAARDDLVVVKRFGEPMYPALVPVDRVTRAPGKPYHTLINADNFHALQVLLYCYEGKVDVIYIDPPYNTGARDWKYNNDYVDSSDSWRHSKWLAMMKRRLLLARRLLREDGVIVVTIDDREYHHLQMLLENVMPDYDLYTVVIENNAKGSPGSNISRCHEYAIFVLPKGKSLIKDDPDAVLDVRNLRRAGKASTRKERPKSFYPVLVKNGKIVGFGPIAEDQNFHPTGRNVRKRDGQIEVWPIDDRGRERRWGFGRDSIADELKRIEVRDGTKGMQLYYHRETSRYRSVWKGGAMDAGKYGTTLVKDIVGQEFPFPKSLYAVQKCLEAVVLDHPNALILDFFAGSGTTLHATALLNATRGGQRRCILVTNNEVDAKLAATLEKKGVEPGSAEYDKQGICAAVTWPRVEAVLTGQRRNKSKLPGKYSDGREMRKGFAENAQYLSLDFLDPAEVKRGEMYEAILPILWMMAGASGEFELSKGSGKHHFPKGCPFCVLLREDHFKEFAAKLADRPDITHVFLVTDSVEAFHEMGSQIGTGKRCVQLYKSYLDNFKINLESKHAD